MLFQFFFGYVFGCDVFEVCQDVFFVVDVDQGVVQIYQVFVCVFEIDDGFMVVYMVGGVQIGQGGGMGSLVLLVFDFDYCVVDDFFVCEIGQGQLFVVYIDDQVVFQM